MIGRVAYLQTYARERTINSAERQQHITEKLVSRRGSIYDVNGCLMAGTIQTQTVFVDPRFMFECYASDEKLAEEAVDGKKEKEAKGEEGGSLQWDGDAR